MILLASEKCVKQVVEFKAISTERVISGQKRCVKAEK